MTAGRLAGTSAGLLATGLLVAGALSAGSVAGAEVVAGGTPGYCPTADGVTVVVDFQELGGGIVVRCAPGPVVPGYSGLDALQDAGFTPTGVRRYGLAFVCRIAGRPTADETIPIEGDPGYHEACINTPPQQAFWGYWYAPNGGSWAYSQVAALSRDAIPGGFEGWSFSLNHASGESPAPGIAPKRPPYTPPTTPPTTSPTTSPTHRPPTRQPPTQRPPTHSTPPRQSPSHHPPSTQSPSTRPTRSASGGTSPFPTAAAPTATPTMTTRSPSDQPGQHNGATAGAAGTRTTPDEAISASPGAGVANPVAAGHNAAGEKVSGDLPRAASSNAGSAGTAVLGIGLVSLLAAGGGLAAWRRRAGRG